MLMCLFDRSIIQDRDDKALSQSVENGKRVKEMADAVKAKPINRAWRTSESVWIGKGDGQGKDNIKSLSYNDQ